jgi:hypothetical protein
MLAEESARSLSAWRHGWPGQDSEAALAQRSDGMIWPSAEVVLYSWLQARILPP